MVSGLGGGLNILAATLLIVFRRPWSMLFTSDPLIVERLGPVIVWLGLSLIGAGAPVVTTCARVYKASSCRCVTLQPIDTLQPCAAVERLGCLQYCRSGTLALEHPYHHVAAGDGVSTVLSGVLRGAGRQRLGAGIMAAVAWGIGLPLQTALAFAVGWGIAGMWLGAAVSSTIQAIVEASNLSALARRNVERRAPEEAPQCLPERVTRSCRVDI